MNSPARLWISGTLACVLVGPGVASAQEPHEPQYVGARESAARTRGISDEQIRKDATARIARDPLVREGYVELEVGDGIVTVSGATKTLLAADRAVSLVCGRCRVFATSTAS